MGNGDERYSQEGYQGASRYHEQCQESGQQPIPPHFGSRLALSMSVLRTVPVLSVKWLLSSASVRMRKKLLMKKHFHVHIQHDLLSVHCIFSSLFMQPQLLSGEELRDVLVAEVWSILLYPVAAVRDVSEGERERGREREGEKERRRERARRER